MALALETHAARLPELGGPPGEAWVLFEVRGAPEPDAEEVTVARAPLFLTLAIDASSSMRGPRFALALQATRQVIDTLGPSDRLAVVTFDRHARLALSPVSLDAKGCADARHALDRLSTGIGTNLDAGWREAADALLRVAVPGALRRVLLLSDGYPSRGETQRDVLRARVAEGRARGVETSVVGIGDGIDEGLCALLAEAGDGRFHYVRDEGAIGDAVAAEVEGAKNLAARDVSLMLQLTPRVERAEVIQRFACRPGGATLDVRLGAVGRDAPRRVLAAVKLKDGTADAMIGIALAQGQRASTLPPRSAAPTRPGFALGKWPESVDDASLDRTEAVTVMLDADGGSTEARRRVAWELLAHRTLAEVRSAWDALDAGDRDAVLRRLDRARALRRLLVERGLVARSEVDAIPDVDVVQAAMFAAGGEAREARRRFASWAHNTQHSFAGVALPVPRKIAPRG